MSGSQAIATVCEAAEVSEPDGWVAYFDVVKAWSKRTDLTSARSDLELAEILFLDAAHLIRAAWLPSSASIVDIGAGVGAPSIPLMLADASLHGTLVEPRRIRVAFLRTVVGTLGLAERARALEAKVDPVKPQVEGAPFTIGLSRATFSPEQWLTIGARIANEVWVLTAGAEPAPIGDLWRTRRLDYDVPSSGAPRTILAYAHRS
jgi:16S rRNA G527 N7-methylase RsmG